MAKEKKTLIKKIENFVILNWWSMSILYIFGALFMVYSYFDLSEKIDKTNSFIREHIQSVVLMTPDGRAVSVVRTKVDPDTDAFKLMIKRVLVDYLIIDYASATQGFNKKIVRNEEELYANSEKLKYFATNYLSHEQAPMKMFQAYMTYLISAINRDELPEHITPWASKITKYKTLPGGKFEIEVEVKFEMNAYYIEYDEKKEKEGTTKIKAYGSFDLEKATANNPLGLKFEQLVIQKIEKREDGEKIK